MIAYRAILSAQYRMLLQYRTAALAGVGTQLFFGIVRVMIFQAFYRSTTAAQPMALEPLISYEWLVQAFLMLVPWGPTGDIRQMIRDGTVAYEMLRPLDLYSLWFVRAIASRMAAASLRCLPIIVIAGLFLGLQAPPSVGSAVGFAAALVGAVLLSSAVTTILNISLLWTVSGDGVAIVLPPAVMLLSGFIFPLPLFPDWAQWTLSMLPFRGILDAPFRVYCGHIPVGRVPGVLLHQVVWLAILVLIGRWLLARGMRRLVVQGG